MHALSLNMRLFLGLPWVTLLFAVRTAASDAYVYVKDLPDGHSSQTLSPVNSRLLLARRLGLSRYHSLEGANDSTMKILNDFGGEQRALLFEDERRGPEYQKNLIIVDDVDDIDGETG